MVTRGKQEGNQMSANCAAATTKRENAPKHGRSDSLASWEFNHESVAEMTTPRESGVTNANINLDDADPADTLYYLAADGIRHAALVDNTANGRNGGGDAITYADLMALPGLMLDRTYDRHWGRPEDPNRLVFAGTPELDDNIMNLDEVVSAAAGAGRLPADMGLNGELLRLGRYPYISTTALGLTEADGKISTTAGNNTLGQVVAFNADGFIWGVRRAAQIEVERIPRSDQWAIVLSTRVAFSRLTPTGAASGIEAAAVLYNVTT